MYHVSELFEMAILKSGGRCRARLDTHLLPVRGALEPFRTSPPICCECLGTRPAQASCACMIFMLYFGGEGWSEVDRVYPEKEKTDPGGT